MSIREEVLVGKVLHDYYLLPKKQQVHSNFLVIRKKIAQYYLKDASKIKDFIHRFREIKDRMKAEDKDGSTLMKFVLGLIDKQISSLDISKKIEEREANLKIYVEKSPKDQKEKPMDFIKRKFKKGLKGVKKKNIS